MALVLPQIVEVKWHGMNKEHYISLGYIFTKIRDSFMANVTHLTRGSRTEVMIKCDFCEKEHSVLYFNYVNSHIVFEKDCCKDCNKLTRVNFTYDQVFNYFSENGCNLLSDKYISENKKLKYKCECGNIDYISFKSFRMGRRCRECWSGRISSSRIKYSIEDINNIFKSKNCLLLSKEYHPKKKLEYICSCGNESVISLQKFINGQRCNNCSESIGEREISLYLKYNNIKYIKEYIFQGCKYKKLLPFDFALFDENNNLTLLIEYDGQQHFEPIKYFGGEKKFLLTKIRDNIKNKYCEENNIPLLRIPYYDYKKIEEIICSKLAEVFLTSAFTIIEEGGNK